MDQPDRPPAAALPPLARRRAELLHLQRTAGNAAVARALSPPPRRVLARLKLSSGQVMSAVQGIPFMKEKLGEPLRGEEMAAQVERALQKYETLHSSAHRGATNTGVMLAVALEGVARVIAEELFDPGIQGTLAVKLFELYEHEIKVGTGLGGASGGGDESLGLTKVLVGDDPLALYMHNELRLTAAAARIRQMATDVKTATGRARTPEMMFHLLRHKWEAQMAAYSRRQIEANEPKGAYNIKESTGEVSGRYLKKLFGDVDTAQPRAKGHGLEFTAEAQQRLDALRAEVVTPSPAPAGLTPRFGGMTEKQERHLTEIEQAEAAAGTGDVKKDLVKAVATSLGLPESSAAGIVDEIEVWLRTVPLTITVWGSDWFDKGVPTGAGAAFKPATTTVKKTRAIADLFQKPGAAGEVEYQGKYEHAKYAAERGDKYLRFRKWKDNLLTGLLDFSAAEMPVFGAANVHWERTRGSVEGAIKDGKTFAAGENYYGDTHFLLRDAVRDRVVYTATDHGPARRNPLLALHDFLKGTSFTGLGAGPKPLMLAQVINAAKTKSMNIRADLPFEIQIFGGVDVARDVASIHYSPAVSDAAKTNIDAFCRVHGLGKEEVASFQGRGTTVAGDASGRQAMHTGIREKLLGILAENQKTDQMPEGARHVNVQAIQALNFRVMTDADFDVLKAQVAEVLSFDSMLDPSLADKTRKLKHYLDTYDPRT